MGIRKELPPLDSYPAWKVSQDATLLRSSLDCEVEEALKLWDARKPKDVETKTRDRQGSRKTGWGHLGPAIKDVLTEFPDMNANWVLAILRSKGFEYTTEASIKNNEVYKAFKAKNKKKK